MREIEKGELVLEEGASGFPSGCFTGNTVRLVLREHDPETLKSAETWKERVRGIFGTETTKEVWGTSCPTKEQPYEVSVYGKGEGYSYFTSTEEDAREFIEFLEEQSELSEYIRGFMVFSG